MSMGRILGGGGGKRAAMHEQMMLSLMSHVPSNLPVQMCKQLVYDMRDT